MICDNRAIQGTQQWDGLGTTVGMSYWSIFFLLFDTLADMLVKMAFLLGIYKFTPYKNCREFTNFCALFFFSEQPSMPQCAVWLCIPLRALVSSLLCCLQLPFLPAGQGLPPPKTEVPNGLMGDVFNWWHFYWWATDRKWNLVCCVISTPHQEPTTR